MITEKQHAEVQNIGMLRAAMTLLERCNPSANPRTRDLILEATRATGAALRAQWNDTDSFTNG